MLLCEFRIFSTPWIFHTSLYCPALVIDVTFSNLICSSLLSGEYPWKRNKENALMNWSGCQGHQLLHNPRTPVHVRDNKHGRRFCVWVSVFCTQTQIVSSSSIEFIHTRVRERTNKRGSSLQGRMKTRQLLLHFKGPQTYVLKPVFPL